MKKTALIILNYNNCTDTRNCILSVLKYNSAPVKFFIVDNASNPEQRQMLVDTFNEIFGQENNDAVLILNNENSGYARGNNLGLSAAFVDQDIEYVMILNNDILFVQDIIPTLIERMCSIHDCGIISPVLFKPDMASYDINCARRNEEVSEMIGKNLLHYWRRLWHTSPQEAYPHRYLLNLAQDKETIPIELPSGSCMLARKSTFEQIGGFDPNTFLYYEENILYAKLSSLNLTNYLCLDLKCVHLGAATTSALPSSYIVVKAGIDSQLYYVKTYTKANALVKSMHWLSAKFFLMSFRIQKFLSRKS